jgi:hypothetical protein
MYSNIEEAWKSSNDLDKYKSGVKPVSRVKDATNEINNNSSLSDNFVLSDVLTQVSEVSDIENVRRKINRTPNKMDKISKMNKNKMTKIDNKSKKPIIVMNNKKHLDRTKSLSVSSQSHFDFDTDLRDLQGSLKKDDGTQCNRLFKHFQACKKCRNIMVEKFSNETKNDNSTFKFNLTDSFIDISKYTNVLKDKNNKNILSIILFGLLVIIILSMICK